MAPFSVSDLSPIPHQRMFARLIMPNHTRLHSTIARAPPEAPRGGRGMEAGAGIEPAVRDLQSRALPLCYPAAGHRGKSAGAWAGPFDAAI